MEHPVAAIVTIPWRIAEAFLAFTRTTDTPTDRRLPGSMLIWPSLFDWQKQPWGQKRTDFPSTLVPLYCREKTDPSVTKTIPRSWTVEWRSYSKFVSHFVLHFAERKSTYKYITKSRAGFAVVGSPVAVKILEPPSVRTHLHCDLAYFPYFEKWKEVYAITLLSVCLYVYPHNFY